MFKVIKNHSLALSNNNDNFMNLSILPNKIIKECCIDNDLYKEVESKWKEAIEKGKKFGFRNAQVTSLGPPGVIGHIMDTETSGVDPDYSIVKYIKLNDGSFRKS